MDQHVEEVRSRSPVISKEKAKVNAAVDAQHGTARTRGNRSRSPVISEEKAKRRAYEKANLNPFTLYETNVKEAAKLRAIIANNERSPEARYS